MSDSLPRDTLMDELLRAGLPEIKLALGDVIDRENARPLPSKYARLLPDTVLRVTLRGDAAEALLPIAADLERELTDSCNRHGSLYDRRYNVELQRTEDADAPLYAVASHAGRTASPEVGQADANGRSDTVVDDRRPSPLPLINPETTSIAAPTTVHWDDGRWVLVVEGDRGQEREVFRIGEPVLTVGRGTDDPSKRAGIAISNAPHVSRRQLALVWEERNGAPGFKVYNLGLNVIHLPGKDVTGARLGKDEVDFGVLTDRHAGWVAPGEPLRIGDHGPTLRIEEVPPGPEDVFVDPDATVFD